LYVIGSAGGPKCKNKINISNEEVNRQTMVSFQKCFSSIWYVSSVCDR
jgi:hypothetical protein